MDYSCRNSSGLSPDSLEQGGRRPPVTKSQCKSTHFGRHGQTFPTSFSAFLFYATCPVTFPAPRHGKEIRFRLFLIRFSTHQIRFRLPQPPPRVSAKRSGQAIPGLWLTYLNIIKESETSVVPDSLYCLLRPTVIGPVRSEQNCRRPGLWPGWCLATTP